MKGPNNYRNVISPNSILKVFTKILVEKISNKIIIFEEQQEFRNNRSTVDAIFISRQKPLVFNKPMFACFVDLTMACDRIRLNDVIETLKHNNVNRNKTRIKTSCDLPE